MQDHPRRSASTPVDLFKTCVLFLAVALLLSTVSFGQTVVVQTQNGTAGIRGSGYTAYGYPWSALAASDREQYVSVFAEVDHIAAWSGNGSTVTFTANNHLSANDFVSINYGTSTGWPFIPDRLGHTDYLYGKRRDNGQRCGDDGDCI